MSKEKYKLWISKTDYFGYGIEVDSLQEAIDVIEDPKFSNCFIRLQKKRPNREPNYWRVLFAPCNIVFIRKIEGTNNWKLTERIFLN